MKISAVLFCLASFMVSGMAFADCSEVKKENLALARAIAADDEIGGRIFDSEYKKLLEEGDLAGEAKLDYSNLDTDENVRVSFLIDYPAQKRDLIVLGENNEGNGFYIVYTDKGDYLNSISFTESETNDWECK